jgi:hypothetical protein
MNHRTAAYVGLGAAAAAIGLVIAMREKNDPAQPLHVHDGKTIRTWTPIEELAPELKAGARYRAVVRLPWYVPTSAATDERIKAYASKRGWYVRQWFTSAPADWPNGPSGDLYIDAEWHRGYETQRRQPEVVAMWELRTADV